MHFYSVVAGARMLYFLSMDFLAYCLQKFRFCFFEILFYFLFIHIAMRMFALPRHGVPYIVNMDRNFVLFFWGSTTVQILEPLLRFYCKLSHKIGSRVEISEPQ